MSEEKIVRQDTRFNLEIDLKEKVITVHHKEKLTSFLMMQILSDINNPRKVHESHRYELKFKPY